MPEKDNRETRTIGVNDVARLNNTDITDNDAARLAAADKVTPPPPDERTDREKEIDDRLTVLEDEITARRDEQKALVRERDEYATKRNAVKKMLSMSPAERKALGIPEPQIVENAGAIASGEQIGDVGAPNK